MKTNERDLSKDTSEVVSKTPTTTTSTDVRVRINDNYIVNLYPYLIDDILIDRNESIGPTITIHQTEDDINPGLTVFDSEPGSCEQCICYNSKSKFVNEQSCHHIKAFLRKICCCCK